MLKAYKPRYEYRLSKLDGEQTRRLERLLAKIQVPGSADPADFSSPSQYSSSSDDLGKPAGIIACIPSMLLESPPDATLKTEVPLLDRIPAMVIEAPTADVNKNEIPTSNPKKEVRFEGFR